MGKIVIDVSDNGAISCIKGMKLRQAIDVMLCVIHDVVANKAIDAPPVCNALRHLADALED